MVVSSQYYKPVPPAEAKVLAERYDKSIVIIFAWDPVFGMVHTTTWGASALEADKAAEALKKTFADFRQKPLGRK